MSFYPEHPTERMEHNIGSGDKQLTKDSQEAVIKRLGRGDTTTEGLTVLDVSPNEVSQKLVLSCDEVVELDPKPEVLKFQIELMEQDDSICVVVNSDDVAKLPPPSKYQTAPVSMYPAPPEKKFFENYEEKNSSKRKGEREEHTMIIWEAMKSLENDLKKEAKPTKIWNYLRKNIKEYNPNGVIISISHDEMKYFESNGTEGHITKESFRKAIERLRENPPK